MVLGTVPVTTRNLTSACFTHSLSAGAFWTTSSISLESVGKPNAEGVPTSNVNRFDPHSRFASACAAGDMTMPEKTNTSKLRRCGQCERRGPRLENTFQTTGLDFVMCAETIRWFLQAHPQTALPSQHHLTLKLLEADDHDRRATSVLATEVCGLLFSSWLKSCKRDFSSNLTGTETRAVETNQPETNRASPCTTSQRRQVDVLMRARLPATTAGRTNSPAWHRHAHRTQTPSSASHCIVGFSQAHDDHFLHVGGREFDLCGGMRNKSECFRLFHRTKKDGERLNRRAVTAVHG